MGGVRVSKIVNGEKRTYTYLNGLLICETRGDKFFNYSYDANGTLYAVSYKLNPNGQEFAYYYTHNWRGDIVGIYNGNGELRAKYTYDSWGNVTSITDGDGNAVTSPTHVGNLNPFRYRGYYMDTETGFYYLMSRYYDPVTHRFLNADGYFQTGTGILDANMNAYCKNNPINCVDPTGTITLYQAQQSLVNSTGWHGYSLSDIILAYKMGYGSSDEAPFLTAKASVAPYTSIIFGSIKTTSYNGWKIRIDSANTNTNTQKHIHIQGFKKEYAQNIDGSPHDGSKGSPPNSVKKYLKKQGYWDWDANQRKYDESHIDLNEYYNSMKTLYDNNGTTVVMPIDPSMNGVPVAPGYFPGFGYNPGIIY